MNDRRMLLWFGIIAGALVQPNHRLSLRECAAVLLCGLMLLLSIWGPQDGGIV